MKRTRTLGTRRVAPAFIALCIALLLAGCNLLGDSDTPTPEPGPAPKPAVISVTVTSSTPTVTLGGSRDFVATVEVTDGAAQTVEWSIKGAHVSGTKIKESSLEDGVRLTVSNDETAQTLTIVATSTVDAEKFGSATVAITDSWTALYMAISEAYIAQSGTVVNTAAANVPVGSKWVTEGEMAALLAAITSAQNVASVATPAELDAETTALIDAINAFNAVKKDGTSTIPLLTSVTALTAYLETLPASSSPATVRLKLAFNTGTLQGEQIAWAAVNTAVKNGGKYVELDLSACTAADTATADTIAGASAPSGNHFNIIKDNAYIKGVILPDTLTTVGGYAFHGCSALTSVSIPSKVSAIGTYAFAGCTALTGIAIPSGVTAVEDYAFYGCSALISVNIADSVTDIGAYAFYGCGALASAIIPSKVSAIGQRAFYGCSGLKSVTILGNIGTGSDAFSGITSITSVSIGKDVTKIGDSAFYYCSGLTSVDIPVSEVSSEGVITLSKVTSIGDSAFYGCSGLTSVIIPSEVASIGASAFYACSNLTSVTIQDSVSIPSKLSKIGASAFSSCYRLTDVTIPGKVTSIGEYAFRYCSGLTGFEVAESNAQYSAQDGILYDKVKTRLIQVPGAKSGAHNNLPSSLTEIGAYAFSSCYRVTSVTIPVNVTKIGEYAFVNCSDLSSVIIPGKVSTIGRQAFYDCAVLSSVIFGTGSNITAQWDNDMFSTGIDDTGTNLWEAYISGTKSGIYTRSGITWAEM
jgi:hypothetical protein